MTTSAYFSDVVVEIAFNAGFNTPAGSRTWTDVSEWVELSQGISITYGRQDERSQADANTLTLTLDNTDGRFTPGRAGSPYFPNVKLYRPIRVTATPPGGAASVRFVGYINQWPVEWSGTDDYATAPLVAASRLSRLGLSDPRRSVVEETYLVNAPRALYPLGEPQGSTSASDVSGKGAVPLVLAGPSVNPIVFGNGIGPATDELAAPTFSGGQSLLANFGSDVGTSSASFEAWFSVVAPTVGEHLLMSQLLGTDGLVALRFGTNGRLRLLFGTQATGYTDAEVTTFSLADEGVHQVVMTFGPTAFKLYVDSTLTYSETITSLAPYLYGALELGGSQYLSTNRSGFVGTIAQVAIYSSELSAFDVTTHYEAGTTGFAGETTGQRLQRLARWGGFFGRATGTNLSRTVIAAQPTGSGLVDLLRQIESTESAVLYDGRTDLLVIDGQSARYGDTSVFTLDMSLQQVESDFAPQFDPATIVNDASASQVGGANAARVVDLASKDDYGTGTSSTETLAESPDDPLQLASWDVARFAEPQTRIPSVTVDITAQVGQTPSPTMLLQADVGTLITISSQPAQAAASSADYYVEGYTETFGPEEHRITFNVSPVGIYAQVLTFNDAARGFNSSYVFAL